MDNKETKPNLFTRFPKLCYVWIPFVLIALDRITKYWANSVLRDKESIPVIGKAVTFRYLENTGAAWGSFHGKVDILLILSALLSVGILLIIARVPSGKRFRPFTLCLIFIVSGALGNLYDRLVYHHVKDFISFDIINFPVFNVADIYVTCGTFVLAFLFLFYYKEEELDFLPFFGSKKENEKSSE
ncbi:MAG: signal peptidase II [Lachnospiraceae bacterium]|nr:signal peptidase II [Lachnospiraceae bacterium]